MPEPCLVYLKLACKSRSPFSVYFESTRSSSELKSSIYKGNLETSLVSIAPILSWNTEFMCFEACQNPTEHNLRVSYTLVNIFKKRQKHEKLKGTVERVCFPTFCTLGENESNVFVSRSVSVAVWQIFHEMRQKRHCILVNIYRSLLIHVNNKVKKDASVGVDRGPTQQAQCEFATRELFFILILILIQPVCSA